MPPIPRNFPLQEDEDEDDSQPPSPRTALLSEPSNMNLSGNLGVRERSRRSMRRDSQRHRSGTHRELLKLLVNEEFEAKQTRRVLTAALDRLDGETKRAQEAERRALELARHFKEVNDARLAAIQDANRAREELMTYKMQLDTALREISRGSDILKDVEAQRDDAEAAAAKARSTARRLRELQLVNQAREEGRRQGYAEGMNRAYEEAKISGYRSHRVDPGGPIIEDFDDVGTQGTERTLLDELPADILNLPSPPRGGIPLASSVDDDASHIPQTSYSGGAQGSRFRENIASPGASTLASISMAPLANHPAPAPWPGPDRAMQMDGNIPSTDADGFIHVRAPHEYGRQPPASPHAPSSPLPSLSTLDAASINHRPRAPSDPPRVHVRDYAYGAHRASPTSLADSLPSTTISQFEIVSSPRGRLPVLSAIQESSMEYNSPSTESRVRTSMPDPGTFPVPASGTGGSVPGGNDSHIGSPRSRSRRVEESTQPYGYKDFSGVEEWRHSTSSPSTPSRLRSTTSLGRDASPLARSYSPTAGEGVRHSRSRSVHTPSNAGSSRHERPAHRRVISDDVLITVEPPSGHNSNESPRSIVQSGMLSPNSASQSLPQTQSDPQIAPMRTNTQPTGPPPLSFSGLPAGFVATAPAAPHNYYPSYEPPVQSSPRLPTHSLYSGPSADTAALPIPQRTPAPTDSGPGRPPRTYKNYVSDMFTRSNTPGRPASAMGGSQHSRPHTPSQQQYVSAPIPPGVQYTSAPPRATTPLGTSPRSTHRRSASLNATAGATPATLARSLSGGTALHHMPSTLSVASAMSGGSSSYQRYDPRTDLDPAFLASSEELLDVQSPGTMANTRANAAVGAVRPASALSYGSRQ
ncbi:hypothetical protein B0H21DRAFT_360859 [Amylocystis lapponica]|nr:hypothetical protein B0H21DRAFT_360859 [Amylocystis lapponica]